MNKQNEELTKSGDTWNIYQNGLVFPIKQQLTK